MHTLVAYLINQRNVSNISLLYYFSILVHLDGKGGWNRFISTVHSIPQTINVDGKKNGPYEVHSTYHKICIENAISFSNKKNTTLKIASEVEEYERKKERNKTNTHTIRIVKMSWKENGRNEKDEVRKSEKQTMNI